MNRLKSIKKIRFQLNNGGVSIGSWMQLSDSSVAEIMGSSKFEWVAVDMEHGSIGHNDLPNIFRALELGDTLPLARLAEGNTLDCKQVLDAGAGGVIVPMVESASQLVSVRDACRWPPSGSRGVAFSRANLFGKNFDAYKLESQQPLLVAMIETNRALKNLEEILSVEGLDAILIGPYDLSASLGVTADFDHTEFVSSMKNILRQARAQNVPAGIHVVNPSVNEIKARIDEGYRFLAYSIDSVMLRSEIENSVQLFDQ